MPLPGRFLAALAWSVSLASCGDDSGTGRVALQLATRMTTPMAISASASPITAGGDEIVIEQVEMVLRKIKVTGIGAGECAATSGIEAEGDTGTCGEFRAGPALFDLPLVEGAVPAYTATVPAGSYSQVQLQIHRPTNANEDAAFVADHPAFENTSIRVTGTYRNTGDGAPVPFTYTTDLTEVVNVELDQPIEVAAGAELGVTLSVDLAGWFADAAGTGLVDPAEALDGRPLESLVEQNIRRSFRMFEDENADGTAD